MKKQRSSFPDLFYSELRRWAYQKWCRLLIQKFEILSGFIMQKVRRVPSILVCAVSQNLERTRTSPAGALGGQLRISEFLHDVCKAHLGFD